MKNTHSPLRLSLSLGLVAMAMTGTVAIADCTSRELTVFGVGTLPTVTQTLNGYASHTFAASETRIKVATLVALQRMNIKVASARKTKDGEVIQAKADNREIEVEFEALSANTTRVRAVARDGFLNDSATALEIISQTDKLLGNT